MLCSPIVYIIRLHSFIIVMGGSKRLPKPHPLRLSAMGQHSQQLKVSKIHDVRDAFLSLLQSTTNTDWMRTEISRQYWALVLDLVLRLFVSLRPFSQRDSSTGPVLVRYFVKNTFHDEMIFELKNLHLPL